MSPLVSQLEKVLHGRGVAIAVIYSLLLGLVVLFFVAMGPRIGKESTKLVQSLPALDQLSSGQIAEQLGQQHSWNAKIVDLLRNYLASHSDEIAKLAQRVGLRVAEAAKQAWLWLIVVLGIWRLIQDYVSSPRIMGHSMELHPLAAIFGVMAGGEVAGILGIFLSIPVMASLRIVFRRWRLYAEKRKFGPLNEYVLGSQVGHPK